MSKKERREGNKRKEAGKSGRKKEGKRKKGWRKGGKECALELPAAFCSYHAVLVPLWN